ncbi:S41 family peptidase [Chloroflexota bacterium]
MLLAVACHPSDLLQRFRADRTPSQVTKELSTLWDVWEILEQDFGGRESLDQQRLSEGAIQGMLDALEDHGNSYGTPEDYDLDAPDLGAVWQAWDDITSKLEGSGADANVNLRQLQEEAIRGMVDALGNPYTSYLPPAYYELESRSFHSNFEGIGAYVAMSNGQLTIVAPIPDTPAERAGILAGDVILEVDGTSMTGLSLAEATLRIRGPRGTPVDLLVLHLNQQEPETITIIRDVVQQQSVHWRPLDEGIAYLRIWQFLDETDERVEEALQEIASQGFDGLVLDVRHNPGGLLTTTIAVASQFLKEGLVLYYVDGQGKRTDAKVREGGLATEIPLVVLTDLGSASGSEVLAGALQDHQRATVIGTMTFGKGSVNELRRLADGSGLYLTTALWYTPEGRLIEGEGLEPDIFVPMDLRVNLGSPSDLQLSAAVDYLQAQVGSLVP